MKEKKKKHKMWIVRRDSVNYTFTNNISTHLPSYRQNKQKENHKSKTISKMSVNDLKIQDRYNLVMSHKVVAGLFASL